ncbi:MAG: hypothetical protein J6A92_05595 [Lachnospiraceae bacterium]|nr:hypothetical protein [Lachnospiraceae bacterium]
MRKYLKMDINRAVCAKDFYIGILCVICACWFCTYQMKEYDVYTMFTYISWQGTYTLVYAAAVISYAAVFLEDAEYQFWNLSVLRGDFKSYVWAKVLACFFVSTLTMTLGMTIFCFLWHLKNPWSHFAASDMEVIQNMDCFRNLMKPETITLYFICGALLRSLLAGILSLIAAYVSLYIKNRLFVLTVPVVAYFFLVNYLMSGLKLPEICNICYIFEPQGAIFSDSVWQIPYAIGVSAGIIFLLKIVIERKLYREIRSEKMRGKVKC